MNLDSFNRKLKSIDKTLFAKRDAPPRNEREQLDRISYQARETRFLICQKSPKTGEESVVKVIETEDGGFRAPSDRDLQWVREMNHLMQKVWANPDNRLVLETWCMENLDKQHIQNQEKLLEVQRELFIGPMYEEIRSIYQHQYRSLFAGKTYHMLHRKGRHNVQDWRR